MNSLAVKRALCLLLALLMMTCAGGFAEDMVSDASQAGGDEKGGQPGMEGGFRSSADLAAADGSVWQVMDGVIRCVDVQSGKTAGEMPLDALYKGGETYLALKAYSKGVLLVAALEGGAKVILYELAMQSGEIVKTGETDGTAALGFLFDPERKWMEIDIAAAGGYLLLAGLNHEGTYELYIWQPGASEARAAGVRGRETYTAMVPCGEDVLLICTDAEDPEKETLTRIRLPGGEEEPAGALVTGTLSTPLCLAADEAGETLYYIANGIGFRARIGGETEAEPFCSVPEEAAWVRYGAICKGQYIFLDDQGGLLMRDTTQTRKAIPLRILDLMGTDLSSSVLPAFTAANPEYLPVMTAGDQAKDVLNAMLNQSTDYDGYIINLGSDLYRALYNKGYLGAMESGALTAAAETFPERIRSRIIRDGKLCAFPIGVQNNVMLLDVAAVCEITGKSREEIPTDWQGFLRLLQGIGESGALTDGRQYLYEPGVSATAFRITITAGILQDAMLWLNQDESRLNMLGMTLTPVLQELDRTDWLQLGLAEEDGTDESWMQEEEKTSLIEWTTPEIAVMNIRAGVEYWPLSLGAGGERLVPQDVAVLVLNPRSKNTDGMIRFAETLDSGMDIVTRMELNPEISEPVKNETFDEDILYLQNLVPMYEQAIAETEDEEEATDLQEQLNDMLSYLESYEKLGAWIVSEDSIAAYRALENLFVIHGDEFWSDESQNAVFLQYAGGMLAPEQFVQQLVNTLQISRMETE